jgi:hypothetical protein
VNNRNSRVAAAVAAAGVEPNIRILDVDAKTAVAAAQQLGCEVGAIANSLVFDCDGEPLLVMAAAPTASTPSCWPARSAPPRSARRTRNWCATPPIR